MGAWEVVLKRLVLGTQKDEMGEGWGVNSLYHFKKEIICGRKYWG